MNDEKRSQALPEPSPVEHGGRVELRLVAAPDGTSSTAEYSARWFTAESKIEGAVKIDVTDRPEVEVKPNAELPEWLSTFTTTLVSTTARQAKKENTWPRRLTRWRSAPGEKGK